MAKKGKEKHRSRLVSTLEQEWHHGQDHGRAGGGMRRIWWRRLGMAKCRRRHGQGAFWGDQVGPNPTDRAKNGTKRSVICDEQGCALGAAIAGANVHDTKMLAQTIEAIVVERPKPTQKKPQNLCLDAGYDNPTGRQELIQLPWLDPVCLCPVLVPTTSPAGTHVAKCTFSDSF